MSGNGIYPALPRERLHALDVETSYLTAGAAGGRPVVLLHGMSASADSFRELMHDLAGDFWLLAPDLPGFGHSADTAPYTMPHLVEWLAAFQERLGLPPVHLVGHSFGGVLASAYALAYPEDVSSLTLLAPALLVPGSYPEWLRRVGKKLGLMEAGIAVSRVWLERQIRVPFYDPSLMDESLWERRRADYGLARASAAAMHAVAGYDLRPRLATLRQATSVIWGCNDPVVPASDADKLQKMIPQVEVHKLAACGHAPMLERPGEVGEIVRQFLGQVRF
ncbi:MAG: alpha/beta fold hydrolase [Chloroflexi bacterium]|nr:alpha/beta fold hydrolase [Chloroflexota bacterium]MCI0580806.1 alpha/beta fold hydrolase [Chloroflexota bacterium]MCI0648450.1 alpha/beta fold hydrolase [Chloroflexota bacterium]MCI0727582.1 alpha/beta fold hydrolase [Chloroflexota bacterium]